MTTQRHEFEAAAAVGIGMTDKSYVPVCERPSFEAALDALFSLRGSYEKGLLAWYTKHTGHVDDMMRHLREAVDALGYDLVPRLTAAECHEQAIARRVAEDDR